MSSRLDNTSASTSTSSHSRSHISKNPSTKSWVEPASLPDYGDVSSVRGNAPALVKQLNQNTFFSYGVGSEECFGHNVGKNVKFVEVSVDQRIDRQARLEATTVAEVVVSKSMYSLCHNIFRGLIHYALIYRHAERRWHAARWMRRVSNRQVSFFSCDEPI